jgi:hypothetical protein
VVAPELASLPQVPLESAHIWRWFLDLNAPRGATFSVNPISWTDTASYFGLKRIRPDPWEVDLLRSLDDAYLAIQNGETDGAVASAKALRGQMKTEPQT